MKNGFEIKHLTECLDSLESGGRPKGGGATIGEIPSIGGEHLNILGGFDLDSMKFISRSFFEKMNAGKIRERDILIVKDGATTGKTSYVNGSFPFHNAAVNEHVFIVRTKPEILNSRYAFFFLHSEKGKELILRDFRGSAQGGITRSFVDKVEIPVPSLPIQKQIASILEKADAAREKRRQANELTEQFLQSAFLEMFGDPVTNPKGWEKIPLADLCVDGGDLRCGPFGSQLKKEHYEDTGVPVWDIEDVKNDFEKPARYYVSSAKAEELSNYYLQSGDIVMTRRATIGISAVYPSDAKRGIMHSALLRIRVDQVKVNPVFLSNQLSRSKDVEDQISRFSAGAIFESINVSRLKAVSVLVPPKAEQEGFVALVEKVESLRAKQKESEKELDNLFNSLMQKAFMGELVREVVAEAVSRRLGLSPTDLHVALLGKIIMAHQVRPEHKSTLGHVKGEKICHILENFLEIDLGRNPRRMAAGPADFPHLLKVESRATKTNRFQTVTRKADDGRKYIPQKNLNLFLNDFSAEVGKPEKEIDRIIGLFVPMKTGHAEVVATVYAAWNDLLLEGKSPTDDEIVKEARENWTPEKLKIPSENFQKSIDWLRKKELAPKGTGKHTVR